MNSPQGHWFNQRVSTSTVSWHWYIAESKLRCVPSLRGSSYVTAVSQQLQFYSAAVQRCWGGKTLVWSVRCDPFIWMWIERGRMKVDWIFSVQVDKDDRATVTRERERMNWDEDKTSPHHQAEKIGLMLLYMFVIVNKLHEKDQNYVSLSFHSWTVYFLNCACVNCNEQTGQLLQ